MTRIYCGDDTYLQGEPATVLAVAGTPFVIAIFHDTSLRRGVNRYGLTYHTFNAKDFDDAHHNPPAA